MENSFEVWRCVVFIQVGCTERQRRESPFWKPGVATATLPAPVIEPFTASILLSAHSARQAMR